jgi:membrane-associated PAP2 superfamily phosphatase
LIGLVAFFGFHGTGGESVDLGFQAIFWNGSDWLIPKDSGFFHTLAYSGPKALIIIWALVLLAAAAVPAYFPAWLGRRRALYLLVCMAVVPIVCTQLRSITQMATPRDLAMYGAPSSFPHLLLFDAKPLGYPSHAFPAGHASGGFALLSIYFAWAEFRPRRFGLALAGVFGGGMGLYQIARGEHFISHTVVTAAIAWVLCAGLARMLRPASPLNCSAS